MKKNTVRKPICFIGALAVCNTSFASGWTPALTLTSVFTENSDTIVAYTADGTTYASGCYANKWTIRGDTDTRKNREYATLLTAIAAGKKVQLWYEDVCGSWSYHSASAVMIVG